MATGSAARLYVSKPDPQIDLTGLGTDQSICDWAEWLDTCPVDVEFDGGTEEADVGDRCNPDATLVTKITSEITFNFFKKKDPNTNEVPAWAVLVRDTWKKKENIYILMLDEARDVTNADGFWMIATITGYKEAQPLKEGIEISVAVKPSGKTLFQNVDCITCDGVIPDPP